MTTDPLLESLAALAHEQWAGWMKYLFSALEADLQACQPQPAEPAPAPAEDMA